jgi:acetyl esterase/lipase
MALLQTIMEIRRQKLTVMWFGEARDLPLPAGVALSSPWVDITMSFGSWDRHAAFDYLPHQATQKLDRVPSCEAWPANPPRWAYYVDDEFLDHPLVTIALAADWRGAPPVYIATGWEHLADEVKCLASTLHASGVTVVFEEYEAMPHCFAMVLPARPEARRCFDSWSGFVRGVVEDVEGIKSRAVFVKAKTLDEVELSFDSLFTSSGDEMKESIRARVESLGVGSLAKL